MSFCTLRRAYLQETRTLFLKAFSDNYVLEILSQCSALNFYPFSPILIFYSTFYIRKHAILKSD